MPLYRRLPKRGFKSLNKRGNVAILNLSKIQSMIDKSQNAIKDSISLKILKEKISKQKIFKTEDTGSGELKKNIEIIAHFASKEALKKAEKAGGKINLTKK